MRYTSEQDQSPEWDGRHAVRAVGGSLRAVRPRTGARGGAATVDAKILEDGGLRWDSYLAEEAPRAD